MKTVPQIIRWNAYKYPSLNAQYYRSAKDKIQTKTYKAFFNEISAYAAGLTELGVKEKSLVGLISENRREWMIFDMAVQSLRAADVPRGCDSTDQELEYILSFTECRITAVDRERELNRILALKKQLPVLEIIIVLDPGYKGKTGKHDSVTIYTYNEVLEIGEKIIKEKPDLINNIIDHGDENDLATIIFTSGTTGKPKGVMLQQKAFSNQINGSGERLPISPGDIFMTILPVWHSYERALQYITIGKAAGLAYSKPVGAILLRDFKEIEPHYLPSVPRIWEALRNNIYKKVNEAGGIKKAMFLFFVAFGDFHATLGYMVKGQLPRFKNRIRFLDFLIAIIPWLLLWPLRGLGNILIFKNIKKLFGRRFRAGISGGGALQKEIDKFFAAANITLMEGYGLTESGPIIGVRTYRKPEIGTVGLPFPGCEIKIVDESGKEVRRGTKGVVMAKGPQIMLGYYKDPERTKTVLSDDGWLNTGDLGIMTKDGSYSIVGREKDTIVLLGGENIEPLPIEHKLQLSPYIEHAVLLGQDKKFLAALIVPNFEYLEEYARDNNIFYSDRETLVSAPAVIDLYREIIVEEINPRHGFKSFEQIFRFKILPNDFELNRELSAKQEFKRHTINDLYKKEIAELFK